jgi:oxygen-independent coproporphyrinogen-3 oxidase
MAGIYIHIPFCRKACHYCNFHFSTTHHLLPSLMNAVVKEITLQQDYLQEPIATIYFGGGTPSLLQTTYLQAVLHQLQTTFTVLPDAEITLEANPDDITTSALQAWKAMGINRLSIGVQSFFEEDLQWMNRAHNAQQAHACIALAKENGFDNLTIDLIYGGPTLSDANWQQNVTTALALGVNHISCYALTVEEKTALHHLIDTKKYQSVDADKQGLHFELLMQWLADAGFEHYEISNFAKPGYRSKHNSSYWQGKNYLGIGPSAHSFNGATRQWNIANNVLYIQSIAEGKVPYELEELTPTQQLNEKIMIGLRTIEGLDVAVVKAQFGQEKAEAILASAQKAIKGGLITFTNIRLQLTNAGKLIADSIISDLFVA